MRFCRPLAILAVPFTLALAGCGGSSRTDAFRDPDVPARAANPDGVPYPTANLGGHARAGSVPGNTIPNFAFQGYVGSDRTGGLTSVSLADFFDPHAAHHKVLHISAAASWCANCTSEVERLVPLVPTLRDEGAVFLIALVEGPQPGTGPSLGDLDAWVDKHHTPFPTVFDSEARRLGTVHASGVPWNALVDTRTMEILDSNLGAPDDVAKYVRLGLAFVDAHPR